MANGYRSEEDNDLLRQVSTEGLPSVVANPTLPSAHVPVHILEVPPPVASGFPRTSQGQTARNPMLTTSTSLKVPRAFDPASGRTFAPRDDVPPRNRTPRSRSQLPQPSLPARRKRRGLALRAHRCRVLFLGKRGASRCQVADCGSRHRSGQRERPWPSIRRRCAACGSAREQRLPKVVRYARVKAPLATRRIDVLLHDCDGKPLCAVEILKTHAVDGIKAAQLNLPWLEVHADDILEDALAGSPAKTSSGPSAPTPAGAGADFASKAPPRVRNVDHDSAARVVPGSLTGGTNGRYFGGLQEHCGRHRSSTPGTAAHAADGPGETGFVRLRLHRRCRPAGGRVVAERHVARTAER
jgi:hypothetical protein